MPLPASYFAKNAQYNSIKISPDGKYFAASVPMANLTTLLIIERKTMKISYSYYFPENEHVDRYYWATNDRVIFTKSIKLPWQEAHFTDGQIYAGNVDGSRRAIVFGYQSGGNQTSTNTNMNRGPERAIGTVVHMLPDDPKNILVSSRKFDNDLDSPVEIFKVNVYSGRKKLITRTPFGNSNVIFNNVGAPVMVSGLDRKGKNKSYFYEDRDWVEVESDSELHLFEPISVNNQGTKLYMTRSPQGETQALYEFDLLTRKTSKIYQHESVDIESFIRNTDDQSIVGLEYLPDKVSYYYLDKKESFAKLHAGLAKAFSGYGITITSRTKDQSEMIIFAENDRNPGDFFLFNNKTKSAQELFRSKDWINPNDMSKRKPIQFEARDGQLIHGYLTLPIKNEQREVALVTLVHGGPYGERDTWWFDSEAQMLANNGYAVLQVNYRGSGGYGEHFEQVAHKKRSTLIQQDIIDGTKWALKLPEVSDDKVCIMGWSFGGYSAVMSALIEPELFKCSIAAAGVYDALEQEQEADYSNIDSVSAYAGELYGNESELLKRESPLTYIDKLKVPVFIVHGGKDERVPPEQAYLLKEALEKRNMPFEWMFKKKEGHGFYNEKNREEFYQKTIEFLHKYLN